MARHNQLITDEPKLALGVECFENAALAHSVSGFRRIQNGAGAGHDPGVQGLKLDLGCLPTEPRGFETLLDFEFLEIEYRLRTRCGRNSLSNGSLTLIEQRQAHLSANPSKRRAWIEFVGCPQRHSWENRYPFELNFLAGPLEFTLRSNQIRITVIEFNA